MREGGRAGKSGQDSWTRSAENDFQEDGEGVVETSEGANER